MFPRLRPLDLFPVRHEDERLICIRDPSGIAPSAAIVPRTAAILAVLCDGTRDAAAIAAELRRRTGVIASPAQVERIVGELDAAFFLEGARVVARRRELLDEFRGRPRRDPSHAGSAYAADAGALLRDLDGWRAAAAPETRLVVERGAPAVLVAPHIDFQRGGAMYARAYATLPAQPPELVIVFGTDHNGAEHPFTLTRKPFATPLGDVATDDALVDRLAGGVRDPDDLFADELHHRGEHSVELQAVWLRRVYGAAAPPILPVLCGSLHRAVVARGSPVADRRVPELLDLLRDLVFSRRVVVIAAADLAHVGPRFGDAPFDAGGRAVVRRADEAALDAVVAGDAEAFFAAVAAERDRFRVCGLAPIYHALALAGARRRGRLLGYAQCDADDDGTSFVSIAAATAS